MIKSAEASGKDVYAAAAAARAALGISEDEGSAEVLVMPKRGFLGIGAVAARVRVTVEVPDEEPRKRPQKTERPPRQNNEKRNAPKQVNPAPPAKEKTPRKAEDKPAAPGSDVKKTAYEVGSREEQVESFLKGLLERMDVEADVVITDREGGGMNVELVGKDMGAVIGRRGETLDAIQHLVNYALNRGGEKHMHISVDAENYRSKREESLVHLAEKMAAKALKYKRSMALEPMNSYERHVIHTALQNYEGVTTSSVGTEPNRRVVVSCVQSGSDRPEHRDRNRSRSNRPRPEKKSAPAPVAEETAPAQEFAPVTEEKPGQVEKVKAAETVKTQPEMPEGYEPINKNKPASREWC